MTKASLVRWMLAMGVFALTATRCRANSPASGPGQAGADGAAGAPAGSTGSAGSADGATVDTGIAGSSAAGTGGATTDGPGTAGTGAAGSGKAGTGATAGGTGTAGSTAGAGGASIISLNNFDGPVFYITKGDGSLHAIQEGTWKEIGTWSGLPLSDNIRGTDADPLAGVLYFTHGAAGPGSSGIADKMGSLGAWNLYTNSLIYDKKLTHGVDQPSYGQGVVYVPSGEHTSDRNWYYYKATDGTLIGKETGAFHPHDTIWINGHRYYGGTEDTYLYVLGLPITRVGPSPSATAGTRPFTVNGSETRAYITWSNYRGFSVGDLTTGKIIKSIQFNPVSCFIAPNHGMSISPDNKELYIIDLCSDSVMVYSATDDPQLISAIPLLHKIMGGTQQNCSWDCTRDGWAMHSRNGKYVYIGDSGDVVDTATHQIATYIDYLANNRHGFVEMDWKHGVIVDTSTHVGIGY
jgi:hypothetical protein